MSALPQSDIRGLVSLQTHQLSFQSCLWLQNIPHVQQKASAGRPHQGSSVKEVETSENVIQKPEQNFTERDPILMIAFLVRVKSDSDKELLSQPMGVKTSPYVLGEPAKKAFRAQRGHFRSTYGTGTWAKALHELLRTNDAFNSAMSRAVSDSREVLQKPNETKDDFSNVSRLVIRCVMRTHRMKRRRCLQWVYSLRCDR